MLDGKIELNPDRNNGPRDESYLSQGDWSAKEDAKDLLPKEASEEFKRGVASATIFWVENGHRLKDTYGRSIAAVLIERCLQPTPKPATAALPTWEEMEAEARVSSIEPAVKVMLDKCIKAIQHGLRVGMRTINVDLEKGTPKVVRDELTKRLEDEVRCSVRYVAGQTDVRDNNTDPDWLEISPPKKK